MFSEWTTQELLAVAGHLSKYLEDLRSGIIDNGVKIARLIKEYVYRGESVPADVKQMDSENKELLQEYPHIETQIRKVIIAINSHITPTPAARQAAAIQIVVTTAMVVSIFAAVGVAYLAYSRMVASREETKRLVLRIEAAERGLDVPPEPAGDDSILPEVFSTKNLWWIISAVAAGAILLWYNPGRQIEEEEEVA